MINFIFFSTNLCKDESASIKQINLDFFCFNYSYLKNNFKSSKLPEPGLYAIELPCYQMANMKSHNTNMSISKAFHLNSKMTELFGTDSSASSSTTKKKTNFFGKSKKNETSVPKSDSDYTVESNSTKILTKLDDLVSLNSSDHYQDDESSFNVSFGG